MNTIDSIRLMVRHYPGGLAAIAARLGKNPNTLEKELRSDSGHKLGLVDACHISSICVEGKTPHCRAYANAVAAECGGFIELEVREAPQTDALPKLSADMIREASETLSTVTAALADGAVSDNDRKAIDKELGELLDVLQRLQRGVRAAHAASTSHIQRAA